MKRLKHIVLWLAGWKESSERDSNVRRLWSRLTLIFAAILFLEAIWGWVVTPLGLRAVSYSALIWSLFFFVLVVFLQPLRSSTHFLINAPRLLLDTLVSAALMIMAFSAVFRLYGLETPDHLGRPVISGDAVYFSAVTFSTLGFGDFAPSATSRGYAAMEALLGNIHLGFVVGSIFAVVGRSFSQ